MEQDLARIEQFLDALWLERTLAENTLSAYRRDSSMAVAWLHQRGKTIATALAAELRTLVAELVEGGTQATHSTRPLATIQPACH
ncbi:site-specific integrase, partial [Salmonella enterica]|uniref:site-specific integrase n=1 Tax=Salmonella enterica TaxID=28901 RepID=UPI00398C5EF6